MMCSCKDNKRLDEIAISWELVGNAYGKQQDRVKARFTITNHSRVELNDENWQLYFNQSPRYILGVEADVPAGLRLINGDWYTLYPEPGFSLAPGSSFSLTYESRHWWIKESDAPKGFYLVFHDEEAGKTIVDLHTIHISPFERPEQLSRHLRDKVEVPSPESRFRSNKSLSYLPGEDLPLLVPTPVSMEPVSDSIFINDEIRIRHHESLSGQADYLVRRFDDMLGWAPKPSDTPNDPRPCISLEIVSDLPMVLPGFDKQRASEAYRLAIAPDGNIRLQALKPAGVFYGIQSLLALLPLESFTGKSEKVSLPITTIEDYPRFAYRGVHVDVARNFSPKESILKMIDILAFYKINTLHLHLTDDEGWRLEIKALPELTEVGAQRHHTTKDAPALHPAFGSGPFAYAEGKFGSGFYTREDFIGILQYAQKHHITVIPEINMPGHARAAIKAMEARYNYYMEKGDLEAAEEYRLIDPEETSQYLSAQLFRDNVVNVARESVYRFFETVLDEVIDMYEEAGANLEIIHVGGDEVPRGAWSASPMIDDLMEQLDHIYNPQNMHSYFTERVLEIITVRGLKMAGWEEVALKDDASGNHVPNIQFANGKVIPFVWNNLWGAQDLAYRLANTGFPVVLCHVTAFYFDLAYDKDPKEPGLYWGGFVNTRSAWHYNPYDVFKSTLYDNMGRKINIEEEYRHMERLLPEARENILGVQAQLWSETILNPEMLEYYLLPKLVGFAETAWSRERVWETTEDEEFRNRQVEEQWNVFANTLGQRELPRLAKLFGGYNYRIPTPGAVLKDGFLEANVEFPGLSIRYTTDGSEPDQGSALFTERINVGVDPVMLKAFDAAGRSSRTVIVNNELINH